MLGRGAMLDPKPRTEHQQRIIIRQCPRLIWLSLMLLVQIVYSSFPPQLEPSQRYSSSTAVLFGSFWFCLLWFFLLWMAPCGSESLTSVLLLLRDCFCCVMVRSLRVVFVSSLSHWAAYLSASLRVLCTFVPCIYIVGMFGGHSIRCLDRRRNQRGRKVRQQRAKVNRFEHNNNNSASCEESKFIRLGCSHFNVAANSEGEEEHGTGYTSKRASQPALASRRERFTSVNYILFTGAIRSQT